MVVIADKNLLDVNNIIFLVGLGNLKCSLFIFNQRILF